MAYAHNAHSAIKSEIISDSESTGSSVRPPPQDRVRTALKLGWCPYFPVLPRRTIHLYRVSACS